MATRPGAGKRVIQSHQQRNPDNPSNALFKTLTRIFSGKLVNYRRQTEKTLRGKQLNKYGSKFKSTSGQEFKRNMFNPFEYLQYHLFVNQQRAQRYYDFSAMEYNCDISATLDIYSDEITAHSHLEQMLRIKCGNEEIKEVLNVLYYDILNLKHNLFGWARTLCKYGDFFLYLDIDEDKGVQNVIGLPTEEIERLEGLDPENPNYVQFQWNAGQMTFENWQIAHLRLLGNDKFAPYGSSILDPARRIFKQLCCRKGTQVWTPDGSCNIEDLRIGDSVLTYDSSKKEVQETKVSRSLCIGSDDVYEVRTAHKRLYLTADHPVMTRDGSYKKVSELTVEDYVILPKITRLERYIPELEIQEPTMAVLNVIGQELAKSKVKIRKNLIRDLIGDISWQDYNNRYNLFFTGTRGALSLEEAQIICERLDIPLNCLEKRLSYSKNGAFIDLEYLKENFGQFMRFLGFLYGDGWVDRSCESVSFSMGVDLSVSQPYVDFVKAIGLNCSVRNGRKNEDSSAVCNVYSKHLCLLLEKLGFVTGTFNKRLPEWIFRCSTEDQREFIMGFVDADGCWLKDGSYRLVGSNKKLMQQMNVLVQQAGYLSGKITVHPAKLTKFFQGECFCKESYEITFRNSSKKTVDGKEVWLERIWNITKLDKEEVYDITVESENHNFLAEGVVVSNCLLEEAMMSYRVTRSAERRVFYVDIGNIPPEDVEQYMQKLMTNMKRSLIINQDSGTADARYNPLNVEEDLYIPVRGQGTGTKIESLPGGQYTGDIDDVKYLRDKLFSALKMPQSYISRGESGSEDKESLSQKDIRFARTIQRIQRPIISELEKIGIIHLYINGFRGDDLLSFSLALNNPSKIAEMQDLELWREKFDVAASATEGYFSRRWVSEKLFNQSDEEFRRNQREIFYDRTMDAEYEKIASAGDMEGGGGGGMGDLGGEDTGLEPETDSSATEETPEVGGEEGGEDDSVLLAKPEDGGGALEESGTPTERKGYLTVGSKGKVYHPVVVDARGMGAHKRHMQGLGSAEAASSTDRNVFKGKSGIDSVLKQFDERNSKLLKESNESNYDSDDEVLIEKNSKQIVEIQRRLQTRGNKKNDPQ